jgi:hypothetical protein
MIADRTYRAVSFLATRVKNRLRFAAPPATKRGGHWRTGRSGCGASEQTVSDGSWGLCHYPPCPSAGPPQGKRAR